MKNLTESEFKMLAEEYANIVIKYEIKFIKDCEKRGYDLSSIILAIYEVHSQASAGILARIKKHFNNDILIRRMMNRTKEAYEQFLTGV